MTKSRNIPGQAEGIYLQETRFLYHLLCAEKGDAVFLECYGDVSTVHADGSLTTEEDKSSIEENPITDRSVNLWKTLSNWILSVEENIWDINKTTFVIYIPHSKFTGEFIEKFHNAKSNQEAQKAIVSVKKELWGDAPSYKLKGKVAKSISEYVEKVFLNEKLAAKIITRFRFERGGMAGYQEINEKIADSPVPPDNTDPYRIYMLGWIKEKIDFLISQKRAARISRDEFIQETHITLRKLDRDGILLSVATAPSQSQAKNQIAKAPQYIRQLDLINQEYSEKISAVCDFLMAEDDRYEWIDKGLIHSKSANDFEENLKRTWRNIRGEVQATHFSLPPDKQGAAVYFKCKQHNVEIENNLLPSHFVSGTYHFLANKPILGWHPNWYSLMSIDNERVEE